MGTTSPIEVIGNAFAAYQKGAQSGDFSGMSRYFASDFTQTIEPPEAGSIAGTYHGFDEFVSYLTRAAAAPGFQITSFEPERCDVPGANVRVRMQVATDLGKSDDELYFNVEDGLITHSRQIIGNPTMAAETYGS